MSYKVEHFRGHWFDEGLVFATQAEAKAYSQHLGIIPSRVVAAESEADPSGATRSMQVNYTFKDGRLERYKAPSKASVSWEEYMLAGGQGIPLTASVRAALDDVAIQSMLNGIDAYKMSTDGQLKIIKSSEMMLPPIPPVPGYETQWVAKPTNSWPACDGCGSRLKGVHAYKCFRRTRYDTHFVTR